MPHLPSRLATFVLFATTVAGLAGEPIRPLGADGAPLNLNFETGTLKDWTATGDAWTKQPVKGDAVAARRGDMKSGHEGQYWIGGYEAGATDDATGRLTSTAFKVKQPWASFLMAGGDMAGTRVEVVLKDGDGEKVIHTARGTQVENLVRSVVDLRAVQGKEIFVRIVDEQKGGWGHVNFDDFVFHDSEPNFPKTLTTAPAADSVKFAGLSPAEAVKAADVPEGFELKLFAAEPDVVNPIAFCLDDRGRVWVAEGRTYPIRAKDGEGQDRILVFEDTDGDGKADKRTVFMEKLNLVSGLEIGFGGLWVGAAPNLMFIPIADGDTPKPAGEPRILLDGWGYQDTHETLNTFRWGPDGWLYGCHGVFTNSSVGKPGTPENQRQKINAGFWRYQPVRNEFEVFGEGTSNSWGIDFDANGQLFAEACVIPHLFHIALGGRYQRQAGQHFNPNTYDDIKTIADHRHYVGGNPHGGNGKSDSTGGGHAHAGLMIYQGDAWPKELGNTILMGNIHGQRINMDVPVRKGSGFIGTHGADFINFNDRASQVVDIRQGPGGSAFFMDWYDLNQCHRPQREAHDYTTGRIYKLVPKASAAAPVVLAARSDAELSSLAVDRDEWVARHARRLLQEHAAKGAVKLAALKVDGETSAERVLWTQHLTGNLSEAAVLAALISPFEYVRAWAVQLATEDREASAPVRAEFARLAKSDPSPVVRLYLASAAQRLPLDQRRVVVEPLLAHAEDAGDPNLPLMYWYAVEPIVGGDPAVGAELLGVAKIPILQEYIARRMATAGTKR